MIRIFYKDLFQNILGRMAIFFYPLYKIRYFGKNNLLLNLGCGKNKIPGYINIDINPFRLPSVWMDIRYKLPFDDDSVKSIKLRYVAEHFDLYDLKKILRESLRVLKKEGKVEIIVPDLENAILSYARSKLKLSEYEGIVPNEYRGLKSRGAIFNIMTLFDSQHKIMFDYEFLREVLNDVGFTKIRKKKSTKRRLVVETEK